MFICKLGHFSDRGGKRPKGSFDSDTMTLYFKPLCAERSKVGHCMRDFKSFDKSLILNQIYPLTPYRRNKVEKLREQPGNFLHCLHFEHSYIFALCTRSRLHIWQWAQAESTHSGKAEVTLSPSVACIYNLPIWEVVSV